MAAASERMPSESNFLSSPAAPIGRRKGPNVSEEDRRGTLPVFRRIGNEHCRGGLEGFDAQRQLAEQEVGQSPIGSGNYAKATACLT